jgi:hypothetical protein
LQREAVVTLIDPEFDRSEPPEPGTCPRGRCDGSGWILVSAAYVDHHAPLLTHEAICRMAGTDSPSDALVAQLTEQRRLLRAGWARHVYPCPVCMPTQFERWNGGHWDNRHDQASCPQCVMANPHLRAGKPRRRRSRGEETDPGPSYTGDDSAPSLPPARLDVDG